MVKCPVCDVLYRDWITLARHMVRDSTRMEGHSGILKVVTGKNISQLKGRGSLLAVAKALESKYKNRGSKHLELSKKKDLPVPEGRNQNPGT